MVSALDTKLMRDLARLKGQLITIAMVVAVGIACFITLRGNYLSLQYARHAYYERHRFADVFAHLERAPQALAADLEAIPGVARVDTRVVEAAMVPLESMPEAIRAQVVSLPEHGRPALNDVDVRAGRMIEPGRSDEVLLLQGFAEAHGIEPGERIPAVINGKRRELAVVGLALSPEYVFAIAPGDMAPDPRRFAILWMEETALAAAFQMEGAFNDVSLALQPGAREAGVLRAVDDVLRPYGGLGAIPQSRQLSNFSINGELMQLQSMSTILPVIFLGVAALLLNLVLSRLVQLQRSDIAMLKAVGYSDREVGMHFFKLVLVIACLGGILGVGLGAWLGGLFLDLYRQWFKFPDLHFRFDLQNASSAVLIAFTAAALGAFGAVRGVVRLPPAEAMRPPAPARYRKSILDRMGVGRLLGPAAQMVVRELERRPVRTLLSSFAIACSVGLMVIGGWYYDGIEKLVYTQFHDIMREDILVTFIQPRPERAVRELGHLPGVIHAEGLRSVPVRFRAGHKRRDGAILGYPEGIEMRALRDKDGEPVPLPPDGVVLTDMLATILEVEVGERIEVEVLDGERGFRSVVVSGLVGESFGLQGHMQLDALRNWLGEQPVASMALLRVDPRESAEVEARLKQLPQILGVTRRADILQRFQEQSAGMILTMALIITFFAATITVGVVYNNARVALSMRERDLASLRVLGFHKSEISAILLGELAIQVLVALPFGLFLGRLMVLGIASTIDPETWRMPVILTPKSYAFASVVALAASAASALLVRRKLDRLDLIGVLKTRE
jgi:putative ABC transport system permease protein